MKSLMYLFLLCSVSACDAGQLQRHPAFNEGVGSSGGGIGVQCEGQLSTLDLYEAVNVRHLTLSESTGTLDGDVAKYMRRLLNYYATDPIGSDEQMISDMHVWMKEKFVDVPEGSLSLSQDATLPEIPSNCRFRQIALYNDALDKVYIDRSLWNQLDSRNQAELLLHESVYKMAREYRSRTSDDTRRVLGILFSNQTIDSEWNGVAGKEGLLCGVGTNDHPENENNIFVFFVDEVQNGVPGIRGYYWVLSGYLLLSETQSFTPGLTVETLYQNGFPAKSFAVHQNLVDRDWIMDIQTTSSVDPDNHYFRVNMRSRIAGQVPGAFAAGSCMKAQAGSKLFNP